MCKCNIVEGPLPAWLLRRCGMSWYRLTSLSMGLPALYGACDVCISKVLYFCTLYTIYNVLLGLLCRSSGVYVCINTLVFFFFAWCIWYKDRLSYSFTPLWTTWTLICRCVLCFFLSLFFAHIGSRRDRRVAQSSFGYLHLRYSLFLGVVAPCLY